jgi:Ca-activated chloride channel family protein
MVPVSTAVDKLTMSDTSLPFELTRPAWLIALVVLPFLVYYSIRSLVDFAKWQMRLSLLSRLAIAVLLVLALSGLTLLTTTRSQYVVFVIDDSLSVGEESRKAAESYVAKATASLGSDKAAFVHFASEPGVIQEESHAAPRPAGRPAVETDKEDEASKGTDIGAAIEVAAAAIPPFYVPKIVVLTDGNQTSGDAVRSALNSGIPVSTVPLKTRDDPEVQLSAVKVPAQVQQGEPFNVEVVIDTNHDDEVDVEVYKGPIKVVSERKKLTKGENRFGFRQAVENDRLATYTARVRAGKDTLLDNNSDFGLVFTSGKPRVLIIESVPKDVGDLVAALEEHEIQVDVRPPQGMPDSLSDLQNYELLILSNVPATKLTLRQMDLARTYVRDLGGGLIMLGGDQSFGLGGYYKTALEEILPVRSDFEKEKEKPSLAMVLVIDKSGSMGGDKIELAKEAAKSAIELLGPNDKVGVIAFEGDVFWVSEVHSASDKPFILDRVSTIEAGGGTDMYPAMVEAFEALQATTAKLKHVILLTDGQSAPGDFEGITQSMISAKITVSSVGVGEGADGQLLEEIARIGNGRYYFTDDPGSIPQIFAKETVSASKSAINEQPFTPQVVRTTQTLADLDVDNSPLLLGYVITRPKPTSEVILATEAGDPLLSWWRYGLGMSVAFTSDAKSRWAADWISWPNYGKFWAQVVRHAMRKGEAKGVVVQVEQRDRKATVTLDAIDLSGKFLNQATTDVTVINDQLGKQTLEMAQTAPGRYQVEIPTPRAGSYHLEIGQKRDGRPIHQQSRGLAVGYPEELRLRSSNEDLLRNVARVSGGIFGPSPEDIFKSDGRTTRQATPLWPFLLVAAIVLFVVDVALRRIDFSLILGQKKFALVPVENSSYTRRVSVSNERTTV